MLASLLSSFFNQRYVPRWSTSLMRFVVHTQTWWRSQAARSAAKSKRSAASRSKKRTFVPSHVCDTSWLEAGGSRKKHVPTFVVRTPCVNLTAFFSASGIPEGKRVMHVHHVGKRQEHLPIRVDSQMETASKGQAQWTRPSFRRLTFVKLVLHHRNLHGCQGWCERTCDKREFVITDNTFHEAPKRV